jgi:hypothetical protein
MRLVVVAIAVLILSFMPLLVVGTLDPSANPIGLGLLSVAGTYIALLLLVVAAARGLWRWVRSF